MKRLLLCLLVVGCGDEFSNAPLEADRDFLQAAPSAARLRLSVGAADGTLRQALVEAPAEFYVFTRQTVLGLNALGFNLLRDVDRLVAAPPTVRGADRRVWETPAQGLEPHAARFAMTRADADFDFELAQDDTTTLTGAFSPATGTGALTFDLDAVAKVTGSPAQGQLRVDYALAGRAVDLAIAFDGFAPTGAEPTDAAYHFQRDEDGAGTFDFAFRAGDGRLVEVRSRWQPDGAGRADARVTGEGDAAVISECWGEDFAQVYYRSDEGSAGDVRDCAFRDVSLPE